MIRTAIRLSTLAALTNGGHAPSPTLVAGNQVFDSRKDDLTDLLKGDKPVIIIRTDEDRSFRRDPRTGSALPYVLSRTIALRLEFGVLAAQERTGGDGRPIIVGGWPPTDAGLEAKLDLLEYQINNCLFGYGNWAVWWNSMWATEQADSFPLWDDPGSQGKIKFAKRELTLLIKTSNDCMPNPLKMVDVNLDTNGDPIILPEVPQPFGRVLDKIRADGDGSLITYANKILQGMRSENLPVSDVYPMLTHVVMRIPERNQPDGREPRTQFVADLLKPPEEGA